MIQESQLQFERQARRPGQPRDLRGFIRQLDEANLLTRVAEPVEWKYDLGRRTRESHGPVLFENVVDYAGQSVFTNGLSTAGCFALALGLRQDTPLSETVAVARQRLCTPIPPRIVDESPVLDNQRDTGDLNLYSLPVPHWNERDAGRYLGTWHLNITKDPESGIRNVGVYRMQLLGPRDATVSTYAGSGLARHVARAEQSHQALPVAVAIGVPEPVIMAGAAAFPPDEDELEFAGALRQQPLDLISCRTIDLEVPAESEIAIEGVIHPHRRVQDGPFFDFMGKPHTNPAAFYFEAKRLMFRDRPILRGASVGNPGAEDHQLFAFLAELGLVDFGGAELLRRRMFRAFQSIARMQSGSDKSAAARPD